MQVLLMNAPKGTQVGPKPRTGSFTGVAVHLASAIAIIIPRPLTQAAADGGWPEYAAARYGAVCVLTPNSRAKRAVGSPLAIPRSNSTKVAGRCRVFAKAVPVRSV